jgi:hypothetical protein
LLVIGAASLAWLSGCSEVWIDPDDLSSGGGGATIASSASASTMTNTSSTGAPTLCDDFCDVTGNCILACQGACNGFLLSPCEAEGEDLMRCLVEHYDSSTCSAPPGEPGALNACPRETEAFVACRSTMADRCGIGGTFGAPEQNGWCETEAFCENGMRTYLCQVEGESSECFCYLNSILLQSCSQPHTPYPGDCHHQESCCAAVLGPIQ